MGVARATFSPSGVSPAVVREGLVGLRHAMRVCALPDGRTAILGRFHQLVRQAKRHGFFAAGTGGLDDPAHRQCLAAGRPHFNWNLVRGATDAARLHFDHGLHVVECRREHLDRLTALLAGLLGNAVERAVDDALGGGLLAVLHDDVHELGKHLVVEFRVRENRADRSLGSTGHVWYPLGLRALRAVLGPALLALAHARAIQRAANGVIAHAREILHATATD